MQEDRATGWRGRPHRRHPDPHGPPHRSREPPNYSGKHRSHGLRFPALTDDPAIVTGYKATRARKLTPGEKQANRVLAAAHAPVGHRFAHLKTWHILPRLRTDPTRATDLPRALLVLSNLELSR